MATYGIGDMAAEASELLECAPNARQGRNQGWWFPTLNRSQTTWTRSCHHRGQPSFWDYKEACYDSQMKGSKRGSASPKRLQRAFYGESSPEPSLDEIADKSCKVRIRHAKQRKRRQLWVNLLTERPPLRRSCASTHTI